MIGDDIAKSYRKTQSLRATAAETGVSEGVVRKVLITRGVISSPLIERIRELQNAGMPQKDIAELLGVSTSCVNSNSGYIRGTYLDAQKSQNAVKIKAWREQRKK